jgi:ribonuclease HI
MNRITVATDGGCYPNPGPAGWAWVAEDGRYGCGSLAEATNNVAELLAIKEVMAAFPDTPLKIIYDSKYAVDAICGLGDSWLARGQHQRKNLALIERMIGQLKARPPTADIEWEWVKGHTGHPLNEAADRLAARMVAVGTESREEGTIKAMSTPTPPREGLVLGMTGLARSGKDTVADRLVERHGFTRFAMADKLKVAALALDPLVPDLRSNAPPCAPPLRLSEVVSAVGWHDAKAQQEIRRTLQRLGSEAGWMLHGEALWTHHVQFGIDALPADAPIVITDVRMPYEDHWIHAMGGLLIRTIRPQASELTGEQRTHISEKGDLTIDFVIDNDGTIEDLHAEVDGLAEKVLAAHGARV